MTPSETQEERDPHMASAHVILARANPEQIRRLLQDIRKSARQHASRSDMQ
ncbi:hypothetical protein GGQ68_004424 [Sagittula marina]|uniref:Uncharacterized protein n=1 Tax=Sagittula marina TaxID=943940 RepID=A0A7W6GV08_9RHOB|nr:hypothetical protein [Sagittula marina]